MLVKLKLSREENISFYGKEEILIDMEEYLKGVVPSEIGNAHVQACAAQAIAARTFASNRMAAAGYTTDKSSTDQAFRASRLTGYKNAYEGIELTKGIVLYYNDKLAKCYYYHSNGGRTKTSKEVWGGVNYPYLIAQNDPYDKEKQNGHCVGLSQTGAIARANSGHDYKQILNFYFPGTILVKQEEKTMTEKENKVYSWLQERPGEGYVWGASGYILTEQKLNELIKQYPDHVSYEKNSKWLGKRVWDCAQLVRFAMKEVGISMVSGATSQWKSKIWQEKGTIDTLPKDKICCLYRQTSDGVMQHTGIYTGDNYFIDARGSSSGVLKTKYSTTTYKWTHWGIPKGLYTNTTSTTTNTTSEVLPVLYKAIVTADTGKTVNMRNNPSRAAGVVAQVPLGTPVDVIEESGEWSRIGVDGKTGYMMAQYLVKQDSIEPAQGYYVTIKCNSASEAKRLAELLGQAKVG